jgi:hypothetical protein
MVPASQYRDAKSESVRAVRRRALASACAHCTDIAEDFFEEALVAAKRWRFVTLRADFRNKFFARLRNRGDIPG